jgi:D-aminoacyl-tRNA deacylase
MRALLQRVSEASVEVDGSVVGRIGQGFLVLLGVGQKDTDKDAAWLADRVAGLRVFADEAGKMNVSLLSTHGAALVVSQFTLYADTRAGRRPSFTEAAAPAEAQRLYALFCQQLEGLGVRVQRGVFAADMKVALVNDGPVTLLLDSEQHRPRPP